MARVLRRWLPGRAITLLGDGHYSSIDLGHACGRQQVRLLVPLRLDANLFAPPEPRQPGQRSASRVQGAALPKLAALLTDPRTVWTRERVPWYAQGADEREWCSGVALWHHGGKAPLPGRWVLTRDPAGPPPPHAYWQTELSLDAVPLLSAAAEQGAAPARPSPLPAPADGPTIPSAQAAPPILKADAAAGRALLVRDQGRWRVEVTLEESRAHLGVETQRQWSRLAILRSTPGLLGLFSVVVLCGQRLHAAGALPVRQAAWYRKRQATFSDVLAAVRENLWRHELLDRPLEGAEQITLTRADLARVMQAAAA